MAPSSPARTAVRPVPVADQVPEGSHTIPLARRPLEIVTLGGHTHPAKAMRAKIPLSLRPTEEPGVWTAPLRVRAPDHAGPWKRRALGMQVHAGEERLKYKLPAERPWTWSTDKGGLRIVLPQDHDGSGLWLAPGRLRADHNALDRRTFPGSDLEFVVRDQPLWSDWRHGLYLPPPTTVRMVHSLPAGKPVFSGYAMLPPPPLGRSRSDGATIELWVDDGSSPLRVAQLALEAGSVSELRADLSKWAGKEVALELRTAGNKQTLHDHVFIEEPVIYVPTEHPRRIAVVLVDTLRADHLGLYGYSRPTSPVLDAYSSEATVFTAARTVAPWTLPSSRALLSGRQPEDWNQGPLLQEVLADAGFITVSLVANHYLSYEFGLDRGWTLHQPMAQNSIAGTRRASFLTDRYKDRDLFVFLHLMDPHLPYGERKTLRQWADKAPAIAGRAKHETHLLAGYKRGNAAERKELVDWAIGRYDQNILQVDTDLQATFEALGPDAWVVFLSDHGERFFDDGHTIGHGQGLEDDLIRIPFIWRGPGISTRRVDAPVSILDVAPTLIERFTDAESGGAGRSILDTLNGGEPSASKQGVGRILFGDSAWGVVHDGKRYQSRGSEQTVVDLQTGAPLDEPLAPWRERTLDATGKKLLPAWRVSVPARGSRIADRKQRWELQLTGEFDEVWSVEDLVTPLGQLQIDGDTLRVERTGGRNPPREVFISRDTDLSGAEVRYHVQRQDYRAALEPDTGQDPWLVLGPDTAPLRVDRTWQPHPAPPAAELLDDTMDALRELGYLDPAE